MDGDRAIKQRQLLVSELINEALGTSARFTYPGPIRVDTSSAPRTRLFKVRTQFNQRCATVIPAGSRNLSQAPPGKVKGATGTPFTNFYSAACRRSSTNQTIRTAATAGIASLVARLPRETLRGCETGYHSSPAPGTALRPRSATKLALAGVERNRYRAYGAYGVRQRCLGKLGNDDAAILVDDLLAVDSHARPHANRGRDLLSMGKRAKDPQGTRYDGEDRRDSSNAPHRIEPPRYGPALT